MQRREFIAGLGSAAAWPVVARAQQPAMPVIGFLSVQSADDDYKQSAVPFLQGLQETGYVDGQNVAVEYRWAENQADRLPGLVADLVRRRVAVIVAVGTAEALAAKAATTIIPVVFATAADPVALGLVASLNRPGANVTGIANLNADLAPKRLQLLRELIPNAAVFGVLADPALPATPSIIADLHAAARTLGLQLVVANASTDSDLETAFATFLQQRVGAVLVSASSFYRTHPEQLVALAARHGLPAIYARREPALAGGLMSYGTDAADMVRQVGVYTSRFLKGEKPADLPVVQATLAARHELPAIYPYREYALAGGLMSYGTSFRYGYHQVGIYTGRILKGEKPADLPVQQATKLELIFNLKTARALGLTIPETLLATADEVIQ